MSRSRTVQMASVFLLSAMALNTVGSSKPAYRGDAESASKQISVKLWRGCVNTATGLGEIPRQIALSMKEDGLEGFPSGVINGAFMSVVRTLAGVVEVATFPFPLDETQGYDSIITPDYFWLNPSKTLTKPSYVWLNDDDTSPAQKGVRHENNSRKNERLKAERLAKKNQASE